MTDRLNKALSSQKDSKEPLHTYISGILGIPLGGKKVVEVANRNSYLYVRLRNNQSEVIQAFNNQVSPAYNLPVLVERQGNRYVVVSIDTQRYDNNWSSFAPFLPRHGNTHSFDLESGGGGDVVWVQSRQITPLLAMPSGSDGGPNVIINPYTIKNADGTWKYIGNTGTQNLTPYNPSSPTGAIMALVYADSISGNPYILVGSGTVFSNAITGTSAIAPYIPSVTNPNHIPLAAVRLITGSSALSWNNIYDVRQWLHVTPTGSTGAGGTTIGLGTMAQDEGVPLGTGTTFNFVGGNVHASISGSVIRVFVTGSSGGAALTVDDTQGGDTVTNVSHITITGSSSSFVQDAGSGRALIFVQDDGMTVAERDGSPTAFGVTSLVFNDGTISSTGTTTFVNHVPTTLPQSFGYDYKINVTNVSGSMAVSLTHIDGSNPSSANPLIFNIAGSRRELDSSRSFSLASGTNWFNASSTELAGKEIDYFVYTIWTEAGAFRIGMSRIPYGTNGAEFSAANTNEAFIAASNGYVPGDIGDRLDVIGRISSTLSSGRAWEISNERTFVYRPIYETGWMDWTPVWSTTAGTFASVTVAFARYKIKRNTLEFAFRGVGTLGGAASIDIRGTVPFDAAWSSEFWVAGSCLWADSAGGGFGGTYTIAGTPDLVAFRKYNNANWSTSGDGTVVGSGFYEI